MAHEGSELEEEYGRQLRSGRLAEEDGSLQPEEMEEASGGIPQKSHTVVFVLALIVAVASDLADIFIIGAIPLVGDALDAATGATLGVLFLSIGGRKKMRRLIPSAIATLIEFIPLGITDIMPSYTIEVVITWFMVQKENQAQE